MKETSASGSAAVGASSELATPSVNSFCGLNGGMLADTSDLRQRKIAGHAHETARSDELAVTNARDDRHAHDLAGHAWLADAREPICFVDPAQAAGESADRSAQSHFDAFGGGGKIGLAVERSKNGASHQGGAAQAGQDRAAEPLHGNPAAADQATGAAVDRKRRLVAESKGLDLKPPICAAQLCRLVQDRCPPHSRPTVKCFRRQSRLPPDNRIVVLRQGRFAQRRQCPHQSNQGDWTVEIKALCLVALPRACAFPDANCASTAEECGRSAALGPDLRQFAVHEAFRALG